MKAMTTVFLILMTCILVAGKSAARTWRVEKDGSGDFTDLQGAAEAAASGDTIRIGAGRFDDFSEFVCEPDNGMPKLMVPTQEELTIIGAGVGKTILCRPENHEDYDVIGFNLQHGCGVEVVHISGITFEFLIGAIVAEYGHTLDVADCRFVGCHRGVITDFHHLRVTGCELVGQDGWGNSLVGGYMGGDARTFYMANCTWEGYDGFLPTTALGYGASESFLVENCTFKGGSTAWTINESLEFCVQEMRNCLFEDFNRGIFVYEGNVKVSDCVFRDSDIGFTDFSFGRSLIDVSSCSFFNMARASFWHKGFKGGSFRNCLLARGSKGAVVYDPSDKEGEKPLTGHWTSGASHPSGSTSQRQPRFAAPDHPDKADGPYYLDMTNNWWGTTDPDSIQAWIEDGNDVPDLPCFIIWDPFLTQNVAAEPVLLDGFKARFRR